MKILVILSIALLTSCAGPIGIAYTATSAGTWISTGKTIPEHTASRLTDADCGIWDAVVNLAYICEYNRNPAVTYNRNPF
jgi:hypothetical protein